MHFSLQFFRLSLLIELTNDWTALCVCVSRHIPKHWEYEDSVCVTCCTNKRAVIFAWLLF